MKFTLEEVKRGRNLHLIGWTSGYLLVQFRGRSQQYIFGPAIPEEEKDKLLRSPYPDRLFQANIKGNYRCHKIGSHAA